MGIELLQKLESWQEFKTRVAPLETKGKGDVFELLTKYYLQIDPQYKTKLKSVWLLSDVPISLKENLNLPDQDKGIDLIAESYEGDYWAIQCKYREDEDSSISWNELSTFAGLSFGVCRGISFGLICTTTNRITETLTGQDNIGFCTGEVWRNLNSEFYTQLNYLLEQKSISFKPLSPKPHQISAIKNAQHHYLDEDNARGKMIMPCGTGKSMTAYWIAEELKAKNIIVAVPSLALIRQMLKAWLREAVANGRNINWICVASDETVGKIDRDDIAIIKQDLGIPTYTNSGKISEWLMTETNSIKIVFTTYQSGKAIAEASKKADFVFDFGIMDEAHKTVGSNRKLFSHLLFDENIKIRKRLFMTATERRYAGLSDEILSMENEEIYGDTFELLSFKEAIEYQPPILSDYKIITITVDKEEIKDLIQKNAYIIPDTGKWDEEVEAGMLASIIALQKAFIKFPIKHAVSFHSTISKAKAYKQTQSTYSEVFPEFKKISSYHVSGRLATSVRDKIIGEFAVSPPSLITNARCLNEGVDIPNIDCILFADPKKSTIDIVQAVGRALRIAEGKEFGYIIIPILTDTNKNFDDLIEDNSFKDIIITLRALAANDERIIDYFRNVAQGKRKSELFVLETDEKLAEVIDTRKFNEAIYLKVWDRLGKLSWRTYDEAKIFANRFGFTSSKQWIKYCHGEYGHLPIKPPDIPPNPHQVYRGRGWISWGLFLRTMNVAPKNRDFLKYDEAKKFVRRLGIKSSVEWQKYISNKIDYLDLKPDFIPSSPSTTYKNKGWISWDDWLGIKTNKITKSIPFDEAREFTRSLGLKSSIEWNKYCEGFVDDKPPKPLGVPKRPDFTYKNKGWNGWDDWLGYKDRWRSFEEAREFARSLNLKGKTDWMNYVRGKTDINVRLPDDIPKDPAPRYKNKGWISWGNWVRDSNKKRKTNINTKTRYRNFTEARLFTRGLQLKNYFEWKDYIAGKYPYKIQLPKDIPRYPAIAYQNRGWTDWNDWLGNSSEVIEQNQLKYRNFIQAREFVWKLKLKNYPQWFSYCRGKLKSKIAKPIDIPDYPEEVYRGRGWNGYDDWLGIKLIADKELVADKEKENIFLNYEIAKQFVSSLGLKNRDEWEKYTLGGFPNLKELPTNIPWNPDIIYKGNGWVDWYDWFESYYLSYADAKSYVHTLGLISKFQWYSYIRGEIKDRPSKPSTLPSNPNEVYANRGWKGWKDWLGTK